MTEEQGNPIWRLDAVTQAAASAPSLQATPLMQRSLQLVNWWGGPGVIWFAAALWLGGRALRRYAWARAGLRATEALAAGSAISAIVKGLAGRARPFVTPGEPWHWDVSHGWSDARYFSMPSGHTTATAAFACGVLLATRDWPPRPRALLVVPLLLSALLVAAGRVLANQHWLSDVVVGLVLGCGTATALHALQRRRTPSRYDRLMLGPAAMALLAVVAFAIAQPAHAQRADPHGPVFTTRDAVTLGLAAGAGAVTIGWDRAIADRVRSAAWRDNAPVRELMRGAGAFADPGTILLGAGLWAGGKWRRNRTQELIGLRALEAVAVSGLVTGAVKGIAGRARPDEAPALPRSFVLGRGIGDREAFQAFPSGHATAAFAFAAAVTAEWERLAPRRPRWVAPALWTLSAAAAVSRVYEDRHWASDVIVGSTIGLVTGRAVVRWHADSPTPP